MMEKSNPAPMIGLIQHWRQRAKNGCWRVGDRARFLAVENPFPSLNIAAYSDTALARAFSRRNCAAW